MHSGNGPYSYKIQGTYFCLKFSSYISTLCVVVQVNIHWPSAFLHLNPHSCCQLLSMASQVTNEHQSKVQVQQEGRERTKEASSVDVAGSTPSRSELLAAILARSTAQMVGPQGSPSVHQNMEFVKRGGDCLNASFSSLDGTPGETQGKVIMDSVVLSRVESTPVAEVHFTWRLAVLEVKVDQRHGGKIDSSGSKINSSSPGLLFIAQNLQLR